MGKLVSICVLIYVCMKGSYSQTETCSGYSYNGNANPSGDTAVSTTDTYFLVCDTDFTFSCCGILDRWEYTRLIANEAVELMVWRPTGVGDNYRLVSTTSHSDTGITNHQVTPTTSDLVTIGDCIGWHSSNADVIGYKNGGTQTATAKYLSAGVNTASDVDWSTASTKSAEWAILARAIDPTSPGFYGPNGTIDVPDSTVSTVPDTTVTFTDVDSNDELTLTMPSNTYYSFTDNGDGTGALTLTTAVLAASNTVVNLSITATDLCELTATGTVSFNIVNDPPSLTGMLASTSTSEDNFSQTPVTTLTCTDTLGPVQVTVSEVPSNSPNQDLFFAALTTGDEFAIYARAQSDTSQGTFDYNTQRDYALTVVCTDYVDNTTGYITINLLQNEAPVIHNLPDSVEVLLSAVIGTVIFTVNFTDTENDTVNVTHVCVPTPCPFTPLSSGDVQVSVLIYTYSDRGYDIYISVTDDKNTGIVRVLSVTIIDDTIYTDRYKTLFDDTRNIVWFSLLCALLGITAIVTVIVCYKYVCNDPCLCRGRRPPAKRRPHVNFGQANGERPDNDNMTGKEQNTRSRAFIRPPPQPRVTQA